MKRLLLLLLVLAATQSFGQTTEDKPQDVPVDSKTIQYRDTTLRIVHADKNKQERLPAVFINGKYATSTNVIRPDQIENINIIKRDTLIENKSYSGQIYIKTKSTYTYAPKLISLTDLKTKYTDFKEDPVVFMLDGNLINADYDKYLIDENNLLTIIIDKLNTGKDKTVIGVVKLLTKTEENIKARNTIMIRGTETAVNK